MDLLGIGMAEVKGKLNPSEGPERSVGPSEKREGASGYGLREMRNPEVSEKPTRRRFSAEYKMRILKEADACKQPGELGALLRREGLYWSALSTWRRQREEGTLQGLAAKKRGRKGKEREPKTQREKELERENRRLSRRLEKVELMLDIQKKTSELLGIPLNSEESDEDN
jgi:transposase